LNWKRPREAIIKAPNRAPKPRAECRTPLVVASPPKILTAQAGIKVAKEIPKKLVTATTLIRILIMEWEKM
jgi:hypothetical protein